MMKVSDCATQSGMFPKKAFIVCEDQSTLDSAISGFCNGGHKKTTSDGYEVGKGQIVYLSQTLMTWGKIMIAKNTITNRNRLRAKKYFEVEL